MSVTAAAGRGSLICGSSTSSSPTWLAPRTGRGSRSEGQAIPRAYRLAAGYPYEAQLQHELTRRLGLAWTELVKGMGELGRVSEEAIRAFSARRQPLVVLVRPSTFVERRKGSRRVLFTSLRCAPLRRLTRNQRDCGSRPSKGAQGMRRLRARVG